MTFHLMFLLGVRLALLQDREEALGERLRARRLRRLWISPWVCHPTLLLQALVQGRHIPSCCSMDPLSLSLTGAGKIIHRDADPRSGKTCV